jgi:hypothetical protein
MAATRLLSSDAPVRCEVPDDRVVSRELDWDDAMEWLRRHAWQLLLGMTG